MIRQDYNRIDPKRRSTLDYKKKQFATPAYQQQEYPFRLSLYEIPPTAEITLEQFEQWAIDRLRSISSEGNISTLADLLQYWPNLKLARSVTRLLRKLPLTLHLYFRNGCHFIRTPRPQRARRMTH